MAEDSLSSFKIIHSVSTEVQRIIHRPILSLRSEKWYPLTLQIKLSGTRDLG